MEVPSNPVEEKPVEETTEEKSSKRQRLMTEYLAADPQPQVMNKDNMALDELEELKTIMLEANMVRRGVRAMERSSRGKDKAREQYWKYTNQYRQLATLEDSRMVKAWARANKARENSLDLERLEVVPEEDEAPDEEVLPEPP